MNHKTNYNGIANGYHDFRCPTCGWHIRIPTDGGAWVRLNWGDVNAQHTGATVDGLVMGVQVTQDDPYLDVFEDWLTEL